MPISPANPFVGPRPLDRADGIHGRAQEIRELQWFFTSERIVWLHSPSGAGKSSLVQAGLIPRLEADNFEVLPVIRVNGPALPGLNRYEASALACLDAASPLHTHLAAHPTSRSRALIFDQFEEVLTLDPTDIGEKENFFQSLGKALELRDIWALFVIREDYLPALDPYVRFLPTLMNHRFRLDLLSVASAREAMEKISQQGGRTLTPAASEKLGQELSRVRIASTGEWKEGPSVEPVILQVVCRGMWQDLRPTVETIEAHHTPSGADLEESLSRYYADCVQVAGPGQERKIREWIGEKLIVSGIRNQVLQSQNDVAGLDVDLVAKLVKTHLIRPDPRGERVWYELAHDRLVEPALSDNQRWVAENLHWVQRRAALWLVQHKTKAVLLSDRELADAAQWIERDRPALTPIEQEFLRQSEAERKVRAKLRFRTRLAWTFALIMTLATLAAFAAYRHASVREYINLARKEARESEERWGCAVDKGLQALDLARLLGTSPQRNAMEALAEALQAGPPFRAVEGTRLTLAFHPSPPRLAVSSGTQVTLFAVPDPLQADPAFAARWTPTGSCTVTQVSFTPDGARLAFALSNGTALTRPVSASGEIECVPGSAAVEALAYSKSGVLARAGGSAGINLGDRTVALNAQALAFHPGGELLAAGLDDGTVRLLDRQGKQTDTLRFGIHPVTALAWGPNGIAAASRQHGAVRLWEWPAGVARDLAHTSIPDLGIAAIALSPDGSQLASIGAGEDHQLKLWPLASRGEPLVLRTPPATEAVLTDVLFYDSRHVMVADAKGAVRIYALNADALREQARHSKLAPCPKRN